ncbi:MAG TPA: serine hydrolase [Chitinophagaceae bacterium]|nr:serine hydrolase [Chitinophagaceae bacterium]
MRLLLVVLLFVSVRLTAQSPLPRSNSPEEEGVSSEAITQFLQAAAGSRHEFHSFMILRHGKVVAEGWWHPYKPALKHTMYSVSKSFTATAIGFAVAEKKLSVDDKVITYFKDDLPDTVSPNLAQLRISDLLTMSVGHQADPSGVVGSSNDWAKAFLKVPVMYEPGTKFVYNSAATYMLSAIVQKVTGQKIIDYLTPRLFDPLGISGIDWEVDPMGINVGGWGLRLKTEDMAKFGQLFLQKGKWRGKQILPASWVEEATTKKIDQDPNATKARKDSSDWLQGYCYQMWRSRHNSYRGDGAYGQYILVLPEQDAVIAITSETTDMQSQLNLIWKHLLPAFKPGKLPADARSLSTLKATIASLRLPMPVAGITSTEGNISGKTFNISNGKGFTGASFTFDNGICTFTMTTDTATHILNFDSGSWAMGETTKRGPYLGAAAKANRVGLPPFKVAGSYGWKDARTLELVLRYIESPHTEVIHCTINDNQVTIDFKNLFNRAANRIKYQGVMN